MSDVITIARLELTSASRLRWIRLLTAAFGWLTLAAAYSAGSASDLSGPAGLGRTTLALVPVALLLVPLAALVLGVSGQSAEPDSEPFLFGQPVSRGTVLVGRWLGELGALAGATALGFGGGGLVVAASAGYAEPWSFALFIALSVVLGAIFINLVQNGMNLARIESYLQIVVIGVLLILAVVADQMFVTDGGRNLVWKVDAPTSSYAPLASFPNIPNPIFPVGPPSSEAVPTGIAYQDGALMVTLLRGAPFANGTSTVMAVDPSSGAQSAYIGGLKTAIDTQQLRRGDASTQLVLQHSYGPAPFFGGLGAVLRFDEPSGPAQVIDNCLSLPTAMAWDAKTGLLYVTELASGRLVSVAVRP